MTKFLVDEDISPLVASYLRELGYDAVAVREVGLKGKSDDLIIKWLQKTKRIIITGDLDFGEFFYWQSLGVLGVVILRSKSQSLSAFKELIDLLHRQGVMKDERLIHSMVVATKNKFRWRAYGK